jgi:hypothetical protein
MKTILILLLGLLVTTQPVLAKNSQEQICQEKLEEHLRVIELNQTQLSKLASKNEAVSPYEITTLQKNITKRYESLKKFMSFYENKNSNCGTSLISKAVAIYDFSSFGKVALTDVELRRIVLNFTKYEKYNLTDFVATYNKYTAKKYITQIQNAIAEEAANLPADIRLEKSVKRKFSSLNDKAAKGAGLMVSGIAKFWGFISDKLIWREGRLKDNADALEILEGSLKPLDLIYEKRTYTLSNYTIPGHWGHVAIWLGTQKELRELGVWDKKYFAPFKAKVLAGQQILEIRKQGVNYQSLESFINLDQIAVTRVNRALDNAADIFEELSANLDKKYDFQFDAQSISKITCAELVSFSYGNIKWPMTKTLFQSTLKPDDLAIVTTQRNAPVEFILYLKGNKDRSFESLDFSAWMDLFHAPKAKVVKEDGSSPAKKKKITLAGTRHR